jgi:type IV pilus assembly protein PilC
MPVYEYNARNRQGKMVIGTLNATSERDLREALREDQLFLTRFKVSFDPDASNSSEGSLFQRIKLRDLVVASRQLATLVRAGIPINEALYACSVQTENRRIAETFRLVRLEVIEGETMSRAMRKHPKVFSDLYCSLVEAGESGGMLDKTLDIAADQLDREADLREKVKAAMTYPILVLFASVAVVAFMLLFIVPTFAKVYVQFHAELPLVTLSLVALSGFLSRWFWLIALAVVAAFILCRQFNKSDRGKLLFDRLKLKIPLVGKVLRKVAIARFCQTFSGMTNGGVPILRALQISSMTTGNKVIGDSIKDVIVAVKEGKMISRPLEETGHFPPMVVKMIQSGEDSGNMPEMLDEINRFYERDIEYSVDRLTKVMEPLMTVMVGGIVLFVLLALYYPVFNLTKVIRR